MTDHASDELDIRPRYRVSPWPRRAAHNRIRRGLVPGSLPEGGLLHAEGAADRKSRSEDHSSGWSGYGHTSHLSTEAAPENDGGKEADTARSVVSRRGQRSSIGFRLTLINAFESLASSRGVSACNVSSTCPVGVS